MSTKTQQQSSFRFKRWSRAGYSVFASMHRHVTIGVLSVAMSLIVLQSRTVSAQDHSSSTTIRQLDSSSVSAERTSPTRSVMANTAVYTRNLSSEAVAQTLESVLRNSPSIDIRERGGKAVQSDISIRGGSFDQTQVMLNGINFTDVRTGHQTHSLPIDMECVSGIELLDGVQGVGAYAGAVNFKTAPLYERYLRLHLTGGQHGYLYSNISGAVAAGKAELFAAGSWRRSSGYRQNTDFDNKNGYLRSVIDLGRGGTLDFQAGAQGREFGANCFYSLKYPDQFESTRTGLGSLRWLMQYGCWEFEADAGYRINTDRFELVKGKPSSVPYNYHLTHNAVAGGWIARSWRLGKTTIGGDLTYSRILSTVLGEALEKPVEGTNGIAYTKGGSRAAWNFYLRHSKHWNKCSIALSEGVSIHPYGASNMGSAEFLYYPAEGLKFYAGAVQSMRLPSFTDLYYTAAGYVSNSNLKPEEAVTLRTGANYSKGNLSASALIYYRHGDNIIDWVKYPGEELWRSLQITSMNTVGEELMLAYERRQGVIRYASVCYGHISTDKKSEGYVSKYALDYMRNKLSSTVTIAFLRNFRLSATGTLYDRTGSYVDVTGATLDYKPYFLLDSHLSWKKSKLEIYAEATNLTGTAYFDYGGLPMPGLWVNAGVVITLK